LQYPDGYLEAQAASQELQSSEEEGGKQKGKRGKKRKNPGGEGGQPSPWGLKSLVHSILRELAFFFRV